MIAVPSVREVLKEGKIVKISARTGDHQDRYLFLVRGFWISNFQTPSSGGGEGQNHILEHATNLRVHGPYV
jgi:hypothetical protein